MTPRTLRAANFGFYIGCVIFILFACVYTLLTKELSTTLTCAVAFAALAATVWGGYYFTLRYVVDAEIGSRLSPFRSSHIRWADATEISFEESDAGGVATCKVSVRAQGRTIVLSSEVLVPDAVQDVAKELREAGLLKMEELNQNG